MKTFKIIFSEIFFSNRGLLLVYWLVLFGITMLVLASGLSKSKSYLPLEALSIQLFMVFCSLPIVTGRIYDKYFTQGRCSFYLQLPIPIFNHRMVELVTLSLVAFIPYLFTLVTLSISTYIAGHWNSKGFLLFLPASLTTFFLVTATSIFSSTLGRIKGFLFVTVVFLPGYLISAKVNIGFEIADFTQPAKYYYLDHFPAIKLFSAAFVTGCLLNILYVIMVNYRDSQYLKFFKKETNNYWKASIVAYAALLIYLTVDVEKANLSKYTFSGFYSMNILSEKDGAPFVWSSSVPFGEDKIGEVTEKLKGLFTSIDKIYRDQSIERPEIHIQHYKPAKSVTYYISPNKSFDQIGLRANFQKLFSNTDEFLFQILLEILRMESKSWVIQDRALIYWRGYAAYRAGLKKTPLSEYSVFESFPEIKESLHDRAWLRVYFALGPCLFNRLSRNLFPDVKENRDSIDESKFARHKINIDSQTNTIQFLRSNLAGPSRLGSYIENKIDELEMSDGKRLIHRPEFDVSMDEIFPKVYKMKYTQKNYDQKQSSRIEIVDVDKTGWAFFEKSIQFGMDKFSMAPDFLTTQGDKRFTTISWFNEALGCRVYGRWRSLTGE